MSFVYPRPLNPKTGTDPFYSDGLTIREYYAGQALQGFFSGIPFDSETPMTEADDKYLQEVARVCFKMADAMLAESQK